MRIDRHFMEQWGIFYIILLLPTAGLAIYCAATGAFSTPRFSWHHVWQFEWFVALCCLLACLVASHIYVARRDALPGSQANWLALHTPPMSLEEGVRLCAVPTTQAATARIARLLASIDVGGPKKRESDVTEEDVSAVARPVDISAARLFLLGHPVDRISLLALTHLFLCSTGSAKETPGGGVDWVNGLLGGSFWKPHRWQRDEFSRVPSVDLGEHGITALLTDRGSFLLEMKHAIRLTRWTYASVVGQHARSQ